MFQAVILGLVTFVGWGSGDLFTIAATRRIGALLTTFWLFFFSFLLSLVVFPFVPHDIALITLPFLAFNIFLGILYVIGNIFICEAFRTSSAPLVGIIVQAFPAVVLILAALIYKDAVSFEQWVFVAIVFLGVAICSVDLNSLLTSKKIIDRGTVLALAAMILLSIYFTFSRTLINAYGWFLPSFIANACFPIIFFFVKKQKEKIVFPKKGIVLVSVFMAGFLIKSGDFALNWGLSIPSGSSLVAPIAGAAPILFVVMSYLVYRDKLTKQQLLGIIITLVGVVLLTIQGLS